MPPPKRFLLRLDPRLFDALRRWADDDLRSVNAQIEYLLTERARRAGRLSTRRARPSNGEGSSEASGADADGEAAPVSCAITAADWRSRRTRHMLSVHARPEDSGMGRGGDSGHGIVLADR